MVCNLYFLCLKSLFQNHSSKVLHCWKEPIIILRNIIIHRSDDAIWMRNEDDDIKNQTWVLRLRYWWWFEMKSNLNIILNRIMFNISSNWLNFIFKKCCILVCIKKPTYTKLRSILMFQSNFRPFIYFLPFMYSNIRFFHCLLIFWAYLINFSKSSSMM